MYLCVPPTIRLRAFLDTSKSLQQFLRRGSPCERRVSRERHQNEGGHDVQCEVTAVDQGNLSLRVVAFVRIRTRRHKYLVVLPPYGECWRLVFTEVLVEFRVERDVGPVVVEDI